MIHSQGFRFVPGLVLAGLVAVGALTNGCSAVNNAENASKGCDGLDLTNEADASVQAWVAAITDLNNAATNVQAQWVTVCNEINADLGLDTTQTTANGACGALQAHISGESSVTVSVTLSPAQCVADVNVEASCNAQCAESANCDVQANCTGGDVVVGCSGSCSAQCDVEAPSFACSGTCSGECTATAAVSCSGQCTGSCDAPTWNGTCDVGCSASFSGSCGGNCTGMCDGTAASGTACKGMCVGTCDAKASGSCQAQCMGNFSGGTCMGMCTGKCKTAAAASCNGTCNGTCSYMPGSATCDGTCHGTCSVTTTKPSCTGTLNCNVSASCSANCTSQASASLNCTPPQVTVAITGDDAMFASFQAHSADIGAAIQATTALETPISAVVQETATTIGNVSAAGFTCVGSQASALVSIKANIEVSVSASATVSTGA